MFIYISSAVSNVQQWTNVSCQKTLFNSQYQDSIAKMKFVMLQNSFHIIITLLLFNNPVLWLNKFNGFQSDVFVYHFKSFLNA